MMGYYVFGAAVLLYALVVAGGAISVRRAVARDTLGLRAARAQQIERWSPMGIKKHDENDNQSGVPKFVRKAWNQGVRKEAANQKANRLRDAKANKRDGKGKR